jgi:hypothetical protein
LNPLKKFRGFFIGNKGYIMKKIYYGSGIGIIIAGLLFTFVFPLNNKKSVVGEYYCDAIKMTASIQSDNKMTFSVKEIIVEKNIWQEKKGEIILKAGGLKTQSPSVGKVFRIGRNYLILDNKFRFDRRK